MIMFISYKQLLQVYRVLSRGHKIMPIYVKINKKCITFLFRRKWSEPLNISVVGVSEVDSIGGSSGCASFFEARNLQIQLFNIQILQVQHLHVFVYSRTHVTLVQVEFKVRSSNIAFFSHFISSLSQVLHSYPLHTSCSVYCSFHFIVFC